MSCGFSYAQKPELPSRETPNVVSRTFPNPATSFITFEFKDQVEKGSTLTIYSFLGRKMSVLPVNNTRITVSLNEYFNGIYVYHVRDAKGRILATNKFQVVK